MIFLIGTILFFLTILYFLYCYLIEAIVENYYAIDVFKVSFAFILIFVVFSGSMGFLVGSFIHDKMEIEKLIERH